jgi:signal transduction histidine kinase
MPSTSQKRILSLRARILLVFASASLITLFVIILSIFLLVGRSEHEGWQSRQLEAAKASSRQVRGFLDQATRTQTLLSLLTNALDTPRLRVLVQGILLSGPNINEIVLTDADGTAIIEVARTDRVLDEPIGSDWFEQTLQNTETGKFFLGKLDFLPNGNPYFIVASKISSGGVIAFQINALLLNDVVSELEFGETGNAYLVQQNGVIAAHTDASVVQARTSLEAFQNLPQIDDIGFISGNLGALTEITVLNKSEYVNFWGVPVLGVTQIIPGTSVMLYIEVAQSEVYAISRNALVILGGFSLISWIFSMIGFIRLLRDLFFKPLANLQQGQSEIEKGNLGYQVSILRNDELGQATTGFNLMSQQLLERSRQKEASETIIKQRDAILEAVAFSSEKLLKTSDWRNAIDAVLARLGTASQASRIYIFQNQPPTPEGAILTDEKYEWVAEGITPQLDNPLLQNLPLDDLLPRWKKILSEGGSIEGRIKDFPEIEQTLLTPQNIAYTVVFPVFVNDEWWGFIGFDECTGNRVWLPLEVEALRSATNNLGATIQRQESELVVQSQNETLIKANRELAIARKQAEAANKLKSQFLATMSHELRTPLNAVIGYSQLQLAGMVGAMSDEQKGFQERILINAHHLLNLINEVLDISKIEAGRMDLVQRPISLKAIFDEILVQNRVLAENKGLALELSYDDRLPDIIIGDRGRLKQIIINLISNGIKFTDAGKVSINVVLHNKDAWRMTVTDTGVGIASHEQETIFDEFRQAENGLDRGGTGLGLAIVRKLVIMMGGNIRVNSEIGVGSSFTVTFPIITEIPTEALEIAVEE